RPGRASGCPRDLLADLGVDDLRELLPPLRRDAARGRLRDHLAARDGAHAALDAEQAAQASASKHESSARAGLVVAGDAVGEPNSEAPDRGVHGDALAQGPGVDQRLAQATRTNPPAGELLAEPTDRGPRPPVGVRGGLETVQREAHGCRAALLGDDPAEL